MATPNVGILTNAGKNLIDQVNAGQTKITFSKIVFSSMNNNQLTDDQIKVLTTVTPQEVVVNNPKVTLDNNTGETRIRATGNNEALTDGVYVKTYAVYAKDDSGHEILYGITVSPNPNYLPEYDGVTPQAVTYSYKVNISNTSNITFSNSNDIYVSDTDLAEALQPYAKTVDVNQQLDKKVTDNKDGTEQLNGVKVQPYNKLSDVTNLRNIVLQTDNVTPYTAKGGVGESIQDFPIYSGFSSLPSGTQVYYSYDLVVTNADGGIHWFGWGSPWDAFIPNKRITKDGIHHFQGTTTIPDASIASGQFMHSTIDNSHATYQITNLMVVVGSIPVAHLPAPEDKVTDNKNGTIEVNGSSITPADDSKVVHNSAIDPSVMFKRMLTGDDDVLTLDAGTYGTWGSKPKNYPTNATPWGLVVVEIFSFDGLHDGTSEGNKIVKVLDGLDNEMINIYQGSPIKWSGWQVPNSDTMATKSDVNTATANKADDSKVAHLSGANNFDTVPTVNNNPLLLASSLPSDLARTGANQEFTGKNTFDTAPIDKTTGHPYITKDGVPSDVARTGQAQTFTAAQTFSIAPTITDASKDKGDNQAATMADLKSVEKSAWHQLSMPDCNGMKEITLLYRNFISDHYMELYAHGRGINSDIKGPTMLDLSSLIDNIKSVSGYAIGDMGAGHIAFLIGTAESFNSMDLMASENKVILGSNSTIQESDLIVIVGDSSPFAKVTYDNWIGL
ncbi:hypothetical protein A8O18_04110 [Lentilactobacillus parabuchneri]|uniref:hypothetical protein n=1 Tax=Lentilactobacillus parabuchneri TaxID=152331 RepID=UPI00080B6C9E|nr:hypothetical protein [Lentilactobacillus parabuchneri]OCB80970.1 hypothetical protein A8O18_04110 [Lentilactobacillus parabuchneri]